MEKQRERERERERERDRESLFDKGVIFSPTYIKIFLSLSFFVILHSKRPDMLNVHACVHSTI